MTDLGWTKGAICELLHCSPSELDERCREEPDIEFLAAYLNRKNELTKSSL